jgi:L-lactate dehydrogenase complex protein LldG
VVFVDSLIDITNYIRQHFQSGHNLVSTVAGIECVANIPPAIDPHSLETVELAVVPAIFAVAENGAVWLTDDQLRVRVLPFICQHLAVIVDERNIVQHMHEAYEKIASSDYGFGVFIAGPSKTADIEQSLVLGAHGPRSMTVFIMKDQ